jgi:type I restriction enzyme M protein
MAKQEIKTDGMVRKMLQDVNIPFSEQGSDIKEINDALKSSSKKGTGKVGFPEFVAVVGDYLLVIEDKADVTHHVKIDDKGLISTMTKDVVEYAENGAYFYGKHLIENTSYKKIFAFGVSGSDKDYKITPLFINEREYCQVLDDVESFAQFSPKNIQDYYERNVLKIDKKDADLETIMKATKELHEYLRDYSNLETKEKPLIVSGILLALREIGKGSFSIDNLKGDDIKTDGSIIFDAINDNLKRSNVSPDVKKEKVLNRFAFIKDSKMLNEVNPKLGMTPNKYYAKFIYDHIFETVKNSSSAEDYIGRFYGEFMSYSGGDGQTLGIILTPSHITSLFCDLLDLKPSDKVLDPTCGTGGFLVAAMHKMLGATSDPEKQNHIRKEQLHGIEIQEYMFTIATTNMILRGDGKSNIVNDDFLKKNPNELQLKGCNVGMMNPPYSQGKKDSSLYEILFVEHLLDSLVPGGKAAVIVPLSTMTGKTNIEQRAKERILKKHTLEGVITLNPNTFYGVGTNTCIAVFTAGQPNPAKHLAKFIDFKDDGFDVAQHVGLVEKPDAKDKRQHLLDVWFDRIDAPTKFSVKSTVKPEDEWLHSFYYFNEEIPTEKDVEQSVSDYLTFEFKMVMDGREYLFQSKNSRGGGEND